MLRAVVGFLLIKLASLVVNLVWFPVLGTGRPGSRLPGADSRPTVSLLVPMRDEAATLARFLPALLDQSGVTELIVLDDESSDGSAALAKTLLAGVPTARLVSGTPPPPGWVGKNWACEQLASQAAGELLIFCDADVLPAAGAVEAVLRAMAEQQADVFSVFPRQLTGSLGEALLTPLIDDVLLCFLPFGLLSVDVPAAATANGSLLALNRRALAELAGFAAVRSEIVEDVAIARRIRRAGLRLGLALGGNLAQTRMYAGYREAVTGLGRGLLDVTGGSKLRLTAATGWHLAAYTLPALAAISRRRWLLPLGLGLAERLLVALKCHPAAVWQTVLTPLCPVAFVS
ncbi:MAG TPA: glycosyltransferase family 2 protein, partial [Jatrophihabitans sp.]|nr:glycosyltransferase family 2 protein [Jatrophihabitans sp.]